MKDVNMEVAKIQATLNNAIEAVYRKEEGKGDIDILATLLVLKDQISVLETMIK